MSDKNMKCNKSSNEGDDFRQFLWNRETGKFLGRTGSSWGKIIIFYIIFYAGLAAFFGLMVLLFSLTLDKNRPKWTGSASLIGTNPRVGLYPKPANDLIWFRKDSKTDCSFWSNQLKTYINEIENPNQPTPSDLQTCSLSAYRGSEEKTAKACKMDVNKLGPCNKENKFGYNRGEPCILIKLNKIFDWEPYGFGNPWDWENEQPIKSGNASKALLTKALTKLSDPHSGMPPELREYIEKKAARINESSVEFQNFVNTVWVLCEGRNPADKLNIGPIVYYPMPGIPSYYFPYVNQWGYQAPFVMVQFRKPRAGVLINIECKAWAHNIIPNRQTRVGSVNWKLWVV